MQNVAIFGPKILAVLKRRGKNFGGVFFDSFQQSEQESEKISALVALLAEITNLLPLVVRNCSTYKYYYQGLFSKNALRAEFLLLPWSLRSRGNFLKATSKVDWRPTDQASMDRVLRFSSNRQVSGFRVGKS